MKKRLAFQASRDVRHTVIRVITAHLNGTAPVSWCGLNFDFADAVFDGGDFSGAEFSGGTVNFAGTEFSGAGVNFFLPGLLATPGAGGSVLLCQPPAPCRTVPGRCGDGSGEPVLVGVGDGLGSVADAGLGEEVIDVALYCGLADHQPPGDLYVGESLGDQCEHFGFSLGEPGG